MHIYRVLDFFFLLVFISALYILHWQTWELCTDNSDVPCACTVQMANKASWLYEQRNNKDELCTSVMKQYLFDTSHMYLIAECIKQ